MTPSEKKFLERNLDLIFEFEKYVLEPSSDCGKNSARRGSIHEGNRRPKVQSLE
jgi:hypothetical protein